MKYYRLWIFLTLAGLALMACNLPNLLISATDEMPLQTTQNEAAITLENQAPQNMQDTPVPSLDPQASAKACLLGTWEMENLSSYVIAAIPPDLADEYNLEYKETSGSAALTLTPDGRITLSFDGLIFLFDANVSVFTVPLTVGIDGEATGDYSLDGDTLTTSNMNTSRVTAVAQALGQDVVEPDLIISVIPLVQRPYNRAAYVCSGDTLQLDFPAFPENVPPLVFQRVK